MKKWKIRMDVETKRGRDADRQETRAKIRQHMFRDREPDKSGLAPALAISLRKKQTQFLDRAGILKRGRSHSRSVPSAKRRRSKTPIASTSRAADLRDQLTSRRDSFKEDRVQTVPKGRSPRSRAREQVPPKFKRRYDGIPQEGSPEVFYADKEYSYDVQVERIHHQAQDQAVIYPDGYEDESD